MSAPSVARSPSIAGTDAVRVRAEKFPVWHPDGHMEMHTREVINDLVRHGTWCDTGEVDLSGKPIMVQLTWTMTDPAQSAFKRAQREAILKNGQAAAAAQMGGSGISASQVPSPGPAGAAELSTVPKLTALRAELAQLGGAVDPTAGIAKLQQAIAAAKSARDTQNA